MFQRFMNSTILARHFWNHFPNKPVTLGIKNNSIYLVNNYKYIKYRLHDKQIILNQLDLTMKDLIISETTHLSYCNESNNQINIYYQISINDESFDKKFFHDLTSVDNLDFWHDLKNRNKLKEIDDLIKINKDCFAVL